MAHRNIRQLGRGYTSEVDTIDEQRWYRILQEFDDANLYQTWSYAEAICGRRNMSHLILRRNGEIAAIAQARIAKLPFINVGIAYIRWGPLWRRGATEPNVDTFRQAIRALRNEFVCKQGLVLRLSPILFDNNPPFFSTTLTEEGFSSLGEGTRNRTIFMDLNPPLGDLREGMRSHWKRELKVAERNGLAILEGSEDELFAIFIDIYKEMVSRKNFVEPNDINQFRLIQKQLPEQLKMKIMLCRSGGDICAGLICAAIGKTAVYLFGATSNAGMRSRGSYLLQWKLIERLKQDGISLYNLNGINPITNPGTYKFKRDLAGTNGEDVYFLGRFDSHGSLLSYLCVECGDTFLMTYRRLRKLAKAGHILKLWPSAASQPASHSM